MVAITVHGTTGRIRSAELVAPATTDIPYRQNSTLDALVCSSLMLAQVLVV